MPDAYCKKHGTFPEIRTFTVEDNNCMLLCKIVLEHLPYREPLRFQVPVKTAKASDILQQ